MPLPNLPRAGIDAVVEAPDAAKDRHRHNELIHGPHDNVTVPFENWGEPIKRKKTPHVQRFGHSMSVRASVSLCSWQR